ncbi:uncharacterized protein LOC118420496 [Branchiostoma floridae]|uniref:Uncharacterized protein LOC118420496 n=1 Tax=Branchiostoma floridae TaxID=7739 RepID=A0A9J7LK26_BRAFL|nr:uncharacterized protein LOC118420496 [Branchiostoma floridae]
MRPLTLGDLQRGATVPRDSGAPHDVMPPWMDRDRFDRGRKFIQRHLPGVFLSQYMALLVGFSVASLLDVLLFTGKSSTVEQSMRRYISTARRLLLWHDGDVWDVNSKAHASVMKVRNMHSQVAQAITKDSKGCESRGQQGHRTGEQVHTTGNGLTDCKQNKHFSCTTGIKADSDKVFISQYDMALTQSGFVGFVLQREKFGICCNIAELEDYIFFWRGIGYLLGIEDRFNMCSGNYAETCRIFDQIEHEVVKPAFLNPPQGFDVVTTSFVEGMQLQLKDRLLTTGTMFSFAHDLLDFPLPEVSMAEWCKFIILKWVIWLVERVPGMATFLTRNLSVLVKRENPE